ncbi:unnamed protein product [Prorocentrum cordatum]|uniref:Uncharacterized protein n=1 Tax=Prorocentrum cordatum TaxID=2364126 RepID=A0ABN9TU57_9DINO|nr:unnamed protein product [Polarella glacialis]
MLKGQLQQNHTNRLLQWFEVLAKTIDIAGSQEVSGHFPDVWGQINAYLEQAVRTNSWLREEQQSSLLQDSLACLRNKLNAKQSRPTAARAARAVLRAAQGQGRPALVSERPRRRTRAPPRRGRAGPPRAASCLCFPEATLCSSRGP